jgi:NADH dehydrogenase [ubiquinone] 1 alpha subcomplex assembly factor 1
MTMKQDIASDAVSLIVGVLLMTVSGPPTDAADPPADGDVVLTDFTADSADLRWYVQNDNVMGGRSRGGFETVDSGELIFAGSTNTNGGGFSSIRTRRFDLDLSDYDGIRLRLKGDGRRYTWQLQTTARYRGFWVSYWADFETEDGEWSTVDIPFSRFYPQIRGYRLNEPQLDASRITELGLYIYDKKDGPFELHLDSIAAYSDDAQ